MERDFMGLNLKDSGIVGKEELVEERKDSEWLESSKASAVQWPFSGKASAVPHFMAFKAALEEKTAKAGHSPEPQNFAGANMKQQQSIGGVPVLRPHHPTRRPALGSVAGTAEPWLNLKPSASPQLTIFYGGTVNVFHNISPEKAQAIMLLAGGGLFNASQSRTQMQAYMSMQGQGDGGSVHLSRLANSGGLSGHISVSSDPIMQTGKDSTSTNDEVVAIKPTAVFGKIDPPPKIVASTSVMPAAVPQARKASLARFMEKRKERVMSSAPYTLSKISSE